jgi:hypothetical protein
MHPKQLALIEAALGAVADECVRSPVATMSAGHLRAVVAERLLRDGATLVERGASAAERRLVRLVDDVVQVERADSPRAAHRGRLPRSPDLRVVSPVLLGVDLWARGALSPAERLGGRWLHERIAALADGTSDVLLLACDRRAYDALRVARTGADGEPAALPRLCAALLPPSRSLGTEPMLAAPTLGGRRWGARATLTPMVFGAQRIALALWAERRVAVTCAADPQLDAFEGSGV